jgi:hypothetical protein
MTTAQKIMLHIINQRIAVAHVEFVPEVMFSITHDFGGILAGIPLKFEQKGQKTAKSLRNCGLCTI